MTYSYESIKDAYAEAGVAVGKTVLVKTDFRWLGPFAEPSRKAVLEAHFRALAELIDLDKGTLVVATASSRLCNTTTPFDPANTSSERGVFSEFIRTQKQAVRSHHAFMSHAAIGAKAEYVCKDVSRHAYGLETPKARMLDLDAMYLSVGYEPGMTCSYVHHMEMLMGVPYRYTKEFVHPVVQPDGSISPELFYIYVYYMGLNLKRNRNKKIFKHFEELGFPMKKVPLGQGAVWGYSCRDFCKATASYLKQDIYGWLDEPPEKRPYRE